MIKLKDIAVRAGVSIMTVSKALRDEHDVSAETKTRIKLLAQQLGYLPDSSAQQLRNRKTKLFGLAISSLTNPIFSRIVLAIEERAHQIGYELLLAHTLNKPEREEACIRRFLSRRVDGIFLCPVYRLGTEARIYQELAARRVPTVLLGHLAPFCNQFVNVENDDLLGSYAATQHLIKLGHRRIAFLSGPSGTPWNQERFEGYRRGLRDGGFEVDDKLIFQAGRTIEDGVKAATQMINESCNATAVQAVSDLVAVGCAEVLLNQGLKVPEDISVVGFGNILLSHHYRVPLTTVRQAKFRLGSAAMDTMSQLLRGQKAEPKRLSAELIVRASSGIPPATHRLEQLKTAKKDTTTL
jgi:DNA-binding LacI/PurR family transcriptional regulator